MGMGKPLGVAIGMSAQGPTLRVTGGPNDRAGDAVWTAVQAAREAGWTPTQFAREAMQAWQTEAQEQLEAEVKEMRTAFRDA